MEIEVDISKRFFIISASIIIVILGSFLVYTYGTNNPDKLGHSAGELDFTEQIQKINASSICLQGECKMGWPELQVSCHGCGFSSWWGEASSSGRVISYPSCSSGWTHLMHFNRIAKVQGASGTNAIRDFTSSNSCCVLCYRYN